MLYTKMIVKFPLLKLNRMRKINTVIKIIETISNLCSYETPIYRISLHNKYYVNLFSLFTRHTSIFPHDSIIGT